MELNYMTTSHIFTHWWHFAEKHARHQASAPSVHRRHELGRLVLHFSSDIPVLKIILVLVIIKYGGNHLSISW